MPDGLPTQAPRRGAAIRTGAERAVRRPNLPPCEQRSLTAMSARRLFRRLAAGWHDVSGRFEIGAFRR